MDLVKITWLVGEIVSEEIPVVKSFKIGAR
jgi:hypothetical protein